VVGGPGLGVVGRGQVAKGAVGPDGVVFDPPVLHQHLDLAQNTLGASAADRGTALGSPTTIPSTPCLDPPAARTERGCTGRRQAVAGVRLATSLIRLATSLIPRPIRMNSTPTAIAIAAAPKATTEVNREAWRNEAV
jgi:hypothetical protein